VTRPGGKKYALYSVALLTVALMVHQWARARRLGRPRASQRGALLTALAAAAAEAWRVAAGAYQTAERRRLRGPAGSLGGAAGTVAATPMMVSRHPIATGTASSQAVRPSPDSPATADAAQHAASEPSAAARWWQYTRLLLQRFNQDHCPAFAAALSFFALLSVVPLLLVALAALGFALQDPAQARAYLENVVAQVLPGSAARTAARELMDQIKIEQQVETLMASRGVAGLVGVLTLVWASIQIFVNGATAMNAAWQVEERRSWVRQRLVALGLLLGAGALFLLSLIPSSGPELLRNLRIPWLGLPEQVPWYVDLLFVLVAVALNAAMFTVIYRFLPATEVTWKQAAIGGAAMGGLWELAKRGFTFYLATYGSRNAMYGALGGLMILVTWIYYTSMLLLLGAEVAKLHKDVSERKAGGADASAPQTS